MGHVLGQGRSSIQKHTLDAVRDQIPSSWTGKGLPFQDKEKIGHTLRQSAGAEDLVQSNSSENDKKSCLGRKECNDDDEIVKHMSNLPGFLQQVEKQNSIQEKALNFGVLNWKHLEKWKYNERMPGIYHKKTSSSNKNSSCSVNGPPKMGLNLKRQPSSHVPIPSSSSSSHLNVSNEGRNATYEKQQKYVAGIKSKGKETCSQESEATQSSPIHSQQDNFHRKAKVYDRSCSNMNVDKTKREDPKKEVLSKKEASSSESGRRNLSLPSRDKYNDHREKNERRLDDEVDFTSEFPQDQQKINIPRSIDLDICTSPRLGMYSEGKVSTAHEKTRRPSFSASYKTKDEITEQPIVKGRHPSHSRRISFDLGLSRSLSFKESSEIPQLSSTDTTVKSGPMGPEIFSVMDNFEKHKANASSRGRSSPLRRLLDPFLKQKVGQNENTLRPPNKSLDSMTVNNTGPKGSTSQALLQLTLKNGLPSFKLVVDNSSDMLAAVVKKLPASEKNDPCIIYAFYSVHEIRQKRLNWISQGSKSENCNLGHKIIGHMKISNSSVCVARECLLCGVDEQNPEFVPNKEIAAIIVKNSSENLNDGDLSVTLETEKSKNSNGMVVILPGGPHGLPIKGTHSSLISRWRSGGSCDCGGWDVGCQLRILTDHNENSTSISRLAIDRVDLFVQGGEGKPVCSLETFSNGFYSIELDASISLLEAFATCVAYVTCRKFSAILDAKVQPNEEHFPKYVSCPPLSPAGRI
ncbi:hypothetical protein BUALT_Bualt11G0124400 [Buddleja alternifolia]|uniref:Uncharacterized protein n=1 Tax=Buddleja alternifolia TaxID=168488 RepID=A0AAV6WTQ0_9LAMI|nr:hypothetical protein BUALT_Bualt11G0124400 [Buddleja alternifolia]